MENTVIKAPYLEAIQAITGKTPGEKHKSLNEIAMKISKKVQAGEDFIQIISSTNVPSALEPLVRIKVANILKLHDEVIIALKNEDFTISNLALRAKWFYEGSNQSIVNSDYFEENVFPDLSCSTRTRVIRNLSMYLKNPIVAEQFFSSISRKYGNVEAIPLLLAHDEKKILPAIIEHNLILPCTILSGIYQKHPSVAIEYLKMSYPGTTASRNIDKINFYDYMEFLPKLLEKNVNAFVEICEVQLIDLRLGTKRWSSRSTERQDIWSLCQKKFQRLLSMKLVAEKLNRDQFLRLFTHSFMEFEYLYNCEDLLEYLQHQKESEKLSLTLEAFEKNFGKSLLTCSDKITTELLKIMPAEDRVNQARKKLKEDDYWHMHNEERSLRCYLPTSESVTAIQNKLSKTSDPSNRYELLKQLVFTCQINDDEGALLDVLKYFVAKHSNETQKVRYGFLRRLTNSFDISNLSAEHLAILKDCIEKGHEQNEFNRTNGEVIKTVLGEIADYNHLNNLSIDREIDWIVELGINGWCEGWNIGTKSTEFEKLYLTSILNRIAEKYPDGHEVWRNNGARVMESLIRYIHDLDTRNGFAKNAMSRISIGDYPWILDRCKTVLRDQNDGSDNEIKDKIMELLRTKEKDLYDVCLKQTKSICDYTLDDILYVQAKDPQRILNDWKDYLRNAQKSMHSRKAKLFIKRSRWYQDLPLKLVNQCLADLKDNKDENTFMTLALLLDGQFFTKLVELFVPTGSETDTSTETARQFYKIIRTIPQCMNEVNPPVPLLALSRFCVGDSFKLGIHFMTSIGQRTSVPEVVRFAKSVDDEHTPVKNDAIQLVFTVSSLEEKHMLLTDLWRTAKNGSCRDVILSKMYDLFEKNPDAHTWRMMEESLAGLTAEDETSLLNRTTKLDSIPNEYISQYVQFVFRLISTLEQNGCDPDHCLEMRCTLLNNINPTISTLLPEELCEELMTSYSFAFHCDSDFIRAGIEFAINSYIFSAEDKSEARLKIFSEHFRNCFRKFWNVPHPKHPTIYPMNAMVRSFTESLNHRSHNKSEQFIYEKILEAYISVVPPEQDATSYLLLVFVVEKMRADSMKDFGVRVGHKIPGIIEKLSPEIVKFLAEKLNGFLESCQSEGEYKADVPLSAIEGLIEVGTYHSLMIAAYIAYKVYLPEANEQFNAIIDALHDRKRKGITCLLYDYRNRCRPT